MSIGSIIFMIFMGIVFVLVWFVGIPFAIKQGIEDYVERRNERKLKELFSVPFFDFEDFCSFIKIEQKDWGVCDEARAHTVLVIDITWFSALMRIKPLYLVYTGEHKIRNAVDELISDYKDHLKRFIPASTMDKFLEYMMKEGDPLGLNKESQDAYYDAEELQVGDQLEKLKSWAEGGIEFYGNETYTVTKIEGDILTLESEKNIIEMSREELAVQMAHFIFSKV